MSNNPLESANLESRLATWLENQGYPLEMLVGRSLRRAGFRIFQSDYYIDPETKTPREIDLYAFMQKEIGGILVRISLCIECKVSEKPWILFTSQEPLLAPPARVVQRAASVLGIELLKSVAHRKEIQNLQTFTLPKRAAYGVTQAFTNGPDITYTACMSAAKCASARIKEINREKSHSICEISFPLVVIDGRMFESYLDNTGHVIVSEIQQGTLVWRNQLVKMPHTIIQLTTYGVFERIAKEMAVMATNLFAYAEDHKLFRQST